MNWMVCSPFWCISHEFESNFLSGRKWNLNVNFAMSMNQKEKRKEHLSLVANQVPKHKMDDSAEPYVSAGSWRVGCYLWMKQDKKGRALHRNEDSQDIRQRDQTWRDWKARISIENSAIDCVHSRKLNNKSLHHMWGIQQNIKIKNLISCHLYGNHLSK